MKFIIRHIKQTESFAFSCKRQTVTSSAERVVYPLVLVLLMTMYHGSSELICPDVGYLDSPANLTCISFSNVTPHGYTTSQGGPAAICNLPGSSCTPIGDYMASTINQTHSLLTIPAVQPEHAGEWKCGDVEKWKSSCNLIVVKEPSCVLTHVTNSSSPRDGGDLMANVIGYYCSERIRLKLMSEGSAIELANETNSETRNITVLISVNNNLSSLVFACGEYNRTIPCSCNTKNVRTERKEKGSIFNEETFLITGMFVSGFVVTLIILTCVLVKSRNRKPTSEMQCSNTTPASAPPTDESGEPPDVWGREGRGLSVLDVIPSVMDPEQATTMELSTFGQCSSDTNLSDGDFDDDDGDDSDDGDELIG